jgi:tRNA(Arg) A34 adenosine deaminase TadA
MPYISEKESPKDIEILKVSAEHGRNARKKGNHPFGAVLTDATGHILMKAENTVNTDHNDCGHAETNLMLTAVKVYERDFLATCSLYTTVEPCAMCAGAIYWGNVRRVVFGISEGTLLKMTGNNPENQTFDLPCREVFDRGQKEITIVGPVGDENLIEEIINDHKGFWNN